MDISDQDISLRGAQRMEMRVVRGRPWDNSSGGGDSVDDRRVNANIIVGV